jgi:hypothetical protein
MSTKDSQRFIDQVNRDITVVEARKAKMCGLHESCKGCPKLTRTKVSLFGAEKIVNRCIEDMHIEGLKRVLGEQNVGNVAMAS